MHAQGWYRDPFHRHEDRYFSDGHPTELVRDGAAETMDPPPDGPMPEAVTEVPLPPAPEGEDLLRADEVAWVPTAFEAATGAVTEAANTSLPLWPSPEVTAEE